MTLYVQGVASKYSYDISDINITVDHVNYMFIRNCIHIRI